jgi:hypothetical protein
MCDRLCGNQPTDTAGKAIWRKRYYNNHDVWPRTDRQQKQDAIDEAAAKKREIETMNAPTETAHPAASPQLADAPKVEKEDHVAKVVRLWHEQNPGFK